MAPPVLSRKATRFHLPSGAHVERCIAARVSGGAGGWTSRRAGPRECHAGAQHCDRDDERFYEKTPVSFHEMILFYNLAPSSPDLSTPARCAVVEFMSFGVQLVGQE